MMIALLSALLGFFSSATPDLLKLFRDARDRAHELTLLKLQLEHDKQMQAANAEQGNAERRLRLEAIAADAMRAEQAALSTRLKDQLTGVRWVDALSGSVRPVLTYSFFLLYALVKLAQFHLLVSPSLPWSQGLSLASALVAIWTEEDIAIFSAIMAFWFGSRVMQRARG